MSPSRAVMAGKEALEQAETVLGGLAESIGLSGRQLRVRLAADDLPEACRRLKDDERLSYRYLSFVSGVDYGDSMDYLCLLRSPEHPFTIELRAALDRGQPVAPTLTGLWPTADWHEREAFDLLGIRFEGHSDLRRILNSEELELHPLRKDATPRRQPRNEWQWQGIGEAKRLPDEPPRTERS